MHYQDKISIGKSGEETAVDFLRTKEYQIISRNYFSPYGEIDIIAIDENELVFIEVKTRNSNLETALNSVSLSKQKKLAKTASYFLLKNPRFEDMATRFDVIVILKNKNQIKHLKDAFLP
ncbi:MAG: YraN family protein [Candidatus Cloacimonetes bacterium]|nr:YraN family protein [Candidatus Cloacimonadota bacterium]